MIKLGAAPFHGWFLSLSKSLSLFVLLLISTVQKIIPVLIVSRLNIFNIIIIFVCIVTFFVIFYNRIILLNLIKILALSGINNLV
jgi:NADH-ubiquinone oxidoreductase chain 2